MVTRDIGKRFIAERFKGEEKRYGLVIGIDEYQDESLRNLTCAKNDAQAMYELMTDKECGRFDKDNVFLLVNKEATKKNILKSFSRLQKQVGREDTFLLYYAGYTSPEGNRYYWIPSDAELEDLSADGISQNELILSIFYR